jgi:hypothetical protein
MISCNIHSHSLNRSSSRGEMWPHTCVCVCMYVCMYYTQVKSKHTGAGEGTSPPGSNSVSTCTSRCPIGSLCLSGSNSVLTKKAVQFVSSAWLKRTHLQQTEEVDTERFSEKEKAHPQWMGHSTTCPPSGKGHWTVLFSTQNVSCTTDFHVQWLVQTPMGPRGPRGWDGGTGHTYPYCIFMKDTNRVTCNWVINHLILVNWKLNHLKKIS